MLAHSDKLCGECSCLYHDFWQSAGVSVDACESVTPRELKIRHGIGLPEGLGPSQPAHPQRDGVQFSPTPPPQNKSVIRCGLDSNCVDDKGPATGFLVTYEEIQRELLGAC